MSHPLLDIKVNNKIKYNTIKSNSLLYFFLIKNSIYELIDKKNTMKFTILKK